MEPSRPQEDVEFVQILHPPNYRPGPLHIVLVMTEVLGRVPPLLLTPAWLALSAIASWPWESPRVPVALMGLSFTLLDSGGLALLPLRGRSFGPVTPPLLALTLLRTSVTFTAGMLCGTQLALATVICVQLIIAAGSLYATWIEPFRIRVTRAQLRSAKLNGSPAPGSGTSIRVLHISDLHVEHITPRERQLLDLVEGSRPDVIVLTGDYLNLSSVRNPEAQSDVRALLDQLCKRSAAPVYAITGSPPVDLEGVVPEIFEGIDITWLVDQVADVRINKDKLCLVGLRCTRERSRDAPRLRRLLSSVSEDSFTLLLYHSPDLMPEAVELGVDLYLCGHTHGGQIRLPLFGALITSSAFWKRYEMGRYEEGQTTLYVSRGLGMEGLGAPRARLLSPPEVILWTLSGN